MTLRWNLKVLCSAYMAVNWKILEGKSKLKCKLDDHYLILRRLEKLHVARCYFHFDCHGCNLGLGEDTLFYREYMCVHTQVSFQPGRIRSKSMNCSIYIFDSKSYLFTCYMVCQPQACLDGSVAM